MSGSFCRHPVLAKFTALAAFVCLHFGRQATEEPKKKTLVCTRFFGWVQMFCIPRSLASKKAGENWVFWWPPVLITAFGWCVGMAASVNFCKMIFFFAKLRFFENLRGYAHIKLYFPIKKRDWPKFLSAPSQPGGGNVVVKWSFLFHFAVVYEAKVAKREHPDQTNKKKNNERTTKTKIIIVKQLRTEQK